MFSNDKKNDDIRYTDLIYDAFEFYKDKIKIEIKNEQNNNNNYALIHFFELINKALNKTKDYYLLHIHTILQSNENPNKHDNIGIFRSILFVYDRDLDRCIDLLKYNYNLYPIGNGSIKEKSDIVKEIINKITLKK
ncbi:MAG: hypothetical protein H0X03_01055 [Nitrosopumilus sp.]|nr:hypothetical protein [Nitrosopumilus sp.]